MPLVFVASWKSTNYARWPSRSSLQNRRYFFWHFVGALRANQRSNLTCKQDHCFLHNLLTLKCFLCRLSQFSHFLCFSWSRQSLRAQSLVAYLANVLQEDSALLILQIKFCLGFRRFSDLDNRSQFHRQVHLLLMACLHSVLSTTALDSMKRSMHRIILYAVIRSHTNGSRPLSKVKQNRSS